MASQSCQYGKSKDPKHEVNLAIPFFGYKNHISTDKRYGFIRKYQVTDASCYDGKIFPELLDKGNTARIIWGDMAYRSIENEQTLSNHGFTSRLHRKKPKGRPMPTHVRQGNRGKSKIRAKVEHVFAVQKEQMGLFVRTIGIQRVMVKITLVNISYNRKRLICWEKQNTLVGSLCLISGK